MQGEYCQYIGNFTRSCSEEARLFGKKVWSRVSGTAETSSQMIPTVLAICSNERIDNTRICAMKNSKKDWWKRELEK